MHVTTAHWGTMALTNYQFARQLWDVRTDCEALWRDYFARRYGAAAKTMRSLYEALEQMLSNVSELKYHLARRLDQGAAELFDRPHLRYRREPGLTCEGPTLVEIVEHAERCRTLMDKALHADVPPRIKQRIGEDEQTFTYAERTVNYYQRCVEAFQLARTGQLDQARQHYREARRIAELLRSDTTSTKFSSSHANDTNAFTASRATKALDHLAKLLEH
jgi:hypothetical protein